MGMGTQWGWGHGGDRDVPLMSGIHLLQNGLWVSKDFGERWEQIHRAVCLAKW